MPNIAVYKADQIVRVVRDGLDSSTSRGHTALQPASTPPPPCSCTARDAPGDRDCRGGCAKSAVFSSTVCNDATAFTVPHWDTGLLAVLSSVHAICSTSSTQILLLTAQSITLHSDLCKDLTAVPFLYRSPLSRLASAGRARCPSWCPDHHSVCARLQMVFNNPTSCTSIDIFSQERAPRKSPHFRWFCAMSMAAPAVSKTASRTPLGFGSARR